MPGSYQLPPLAVAADGAVLDDAGNPKRLYDFFGDRVVLLSFIYTTCSDVNGCPLAAYVLKRVQDRAVADPKLRDQLRIVSLSFDPQHDTPAVMQEYGARLRAAGFDWTFLTGSSDAALQGTLDAYDQSVYRDESGAISHILRVLLIDKQRRVRNIYSVSFLHADTVLSDVQTLLLEPHRRRSDDQALRGSIRNSTIFGFSGSPFFSISRQRSYLAANAASTRVRSAGSVTSAAVRG